MSKALKLKKNTAKNSQKINQVYNTIKSIETFKILLVNYILEIFRPMRPI